MKFGSGGSHDDGQSEEVFSLQAHVMKPGLETKLELEPALGAGMERRNRKTTLTGGSGTAQGNEASMKFGVLGKREMEKGSTARTDQPVTWCERVENVTVASGLR